MPVRTRFGGVVLALTALTVPSGIRWTSASALEAGPPPDLGLVVTRAEPLRPPASDGPPAPEALSLDRLGRLFVLDRTFSRILRFDPETASWGEFGAGGQGGARLPQLAALDAAWGPDLYALEPARRSLHRFDLDVQLRAVIPFESWDEPDGEPFLPVDFAVTPSGELFLLDREDGRLRLHDRRGRYLADWSGGLAGDQHPRAPTRVAVSADGTVFVLDPPTGLVRRFARQGTPLPSWRYAAAGSPSDLLAVTPSGRAVVLDARRAGIVLLGPSELDRWEGGAPMPPEARPADMVVAGDTLLYLALPHAGVIERWRLSGAQTDERGDGR